MKTASLCALWKIADSLGTSKTEKFHLIEFFYRLSVLHVAHDCIDRVRGDDAHSPTARWGGDRAISEEGLMTKSAVRDEISRAECAAAGRSRTLK